MGAIASFKEKFSEEVIKQQVVQSKKAPLKERLVNGFKTWVPRLFHTIFFGLFIYMLVLGCMFIIPFTMGYLVGGLGYNLNEVSEMILAAFSGLFFTAWVFVGSYKLVTFVGKFYIKNLKLKKKDETVEAVTTSKKK